MFIISTWKDIPGYEGIYQASPDGLIRSCDRTVNHTDGRVRNLKGKVLAGRKARKGYLQVLLRKDKSSISEYVHRLVAKTYLPNELNLPEVNHIDGNNQNNNVNNLEWCTRKHNMAHAKENNLIDYRNLNSKINEEKAQSIRKMYEQGNVTQSKIAVLFNLDQSHVSKIINKKRWN